MRISLIVVHILECGVQSCVGMVGEISVVEVYVDIGWDAFSFKTLRIQGNILDERRIDVQDPLGILIQDEPSSRICRG